MSEDSLPEDVPKAALWSSGVVWPGLQIALGVGLVVAGIQRADPLALLLTGLAALVLIPTGAAHLLRRPRLEVVDGQLAVKKLSGTLFIPRSDVTDVRAMGVARWGARQHMLRVEYTDDRGREQLDVFTRLDLGTDPRNVVDSLHQLGFGPAHSTS